MINIADDINRLTFKDEDKTPYEMEYSEHYEDILEVVKDKDLAEKIVKAIPKGHLRESKDYYKYLQKMEKEMKS